MKLRGNATGVRMGLVCASLLGLGSACGAEVVTNIVNNGNTVTNLTKLANLHGAGQASVSLAVDEGLGVVVASQTPEYSDYWLRACWYANTWSPAAGVYSVSARVRPAEASAERRVGIIGWLDIRAAKGLVFQVRPSATWGDFRVSTVNFKSAGVEDNETLANLYNLDGTPAVADYGSALSELGTYTAGSFAIMELAFAAPTDADRAAVSNVTARLTAKAYQPVGRPVQVGNTIELLTDLPLPGAHRFGYFGMWASINVPGGVIGSMDQLTVVGEQGKFVMPPTVELTGVTNGAKFSAPVDVPVGVTASDVDGKVTRVELFSNDIFQGAADQSSLNVVLGNLTPGSYVLTGRAMDDSGASSFSEPVTIEVAPVLLTNPIALPNQRNFEYFQFTVTGMAGRFYMVQYCTDFTDWTDIDSRVVEEGPVVLSYAADPLEPVRFFRIKLLR